MLQLIHSAPLQRQRTYTLPDYLVRRTTAIRRVGRLGLAFPAAFLCNLSIGLISFAAIFYLKHRFAVTAATVGLFAGAWNGAYLIGCILLRPFFSRVRPRHAIAWTPLGIAVLVAGMLLSSSLVLCFVLYAVAGFLVAFFWPPLMGWLSAGLESDELSRTTARYNFSWSFSNVVSPLLAGVLVERSTVLPFYVSFGALLAVAALAAASLLIAPEPIPIRAPAQKRAPGRAWSTGTSYRFPAWTGLFSAYLFMGVLLSVFPLYARYRLGIPESLIGLVLVARALSMTIAFALYGRTRFWHFRTLPMAAGQVALAAVSFCMPLGQSPGFFIALLPTAGFALALVYNSALFHAVSGSSDRSGRAAVGEAVLTGGMVIGASVGGFIYELFSMKTLFWGYAVLLVLVAAFQLWRGSRIRADREQAATAAACP